jgi:N4-(beta-N-acetylglucosaminyl)-L-asparaginase
MIIIDKNMDVSVGTSTNGARNKIAGRVGDSALPGAGGYVDNLVGGASATGDGDIMMRFLPSFLAVEKMRSGASPQKAAEIAIMRIKEHYPNFFGAVVCGNIKGEHGAACNGMPIFQYVAANADEKHVKVYEVKCF